MYKLIVIFVCFRVYHYITVVNKEIKGEICNL